MNSNTLAALIVSGTAVVIGGVGYALYRKNKNYENRISGMRIGTVNRGDFPEEAAELARRELREKQQAEADVRRQEELKMHDARMVSDPEYAARYNAQQERRRQQEEMEREVEYRVNREVARRRRYQEDHTYVVLTN